MIYSELVACINKLNTEMEGALPDRTTGKPPLIDGFVFQQLWVHFGLNGSDYDTGNGQPMNDSFLQSIEHLNDGSREFKKVKIYLKNKGFIYERYFSKPVTFYANQGWYPIWQHPHFFKLFPDYLSKLDACAIEFITRHQKTLNDRFVVFSDLLFVRDRDSRRIKSSSVLTEFEGLIWDSWTKQMEYYKPTGVTIANAQAQEFIRNRCNAEKYAFLVPYKNIPVILSPQFSGGALSDPLFGLLGDLFAKVVSKEITL